MCTKIYWPQFIIVAFFVISCNDLKSSRDYSISFKEVIVSNHYLDIKDNSTISSDAHNFSDTILVTNNPSKSRIELYDLKGNRKIKEIRLEREGPNGIGTGKYGFFYHNKDSLFISSVAYLFHLNDNGEVLRRYRLIDDTLGGNPDILISSNKPLKIKGDKLYASVFPNKSAFKKSDLSQWKSFLVLDLRTGNISTFGELPKEMKNRIYGYNFLFHSVLFQEDKMLVLYAPINAIYSIEYNNLELVDKVDIRLSDWKTAPKLQDEADQDMMNYFSHYVLNPSYDAIYEHNGKFIIIGQAPNTKIEFENRVWAKKKTIFVFDANLNLEKVIDTELRSLSYLKCFSMGNYFFIHSDSDNENQIQFVKIKI